ncbi:MAG: hypothetical protein ACOZQL_41810 [Myxococcota bacterium]
MTHCPTCGSPLPVSAISESLGAARCPSCRALIDLGAPRAQAQPVNLAIPEKWQVDALPGSLTVRWRWSSLAVVFLIPFTLFWNGILSVFAFASTEGFTHPERLLIGLAVPHVWVGVGLGYYVLTLLFNSTTVRLGEGTLSVRHGPLWWPGKRDFPAREIQQLFVVEKRGSKGSRSYEVCALLRDSRRVTLVKADDEQKARFLEVKLEQSLGIVDQRVEGEHRR